MNSIELLGLMRQGLLDFIDDLRIILPEEKELFLFSLFVKQMPLVPLAEYVSKNIVPLKGYIKNRDSKYFKSNAVMFEHLGNYKTEVNRFQMLWDANEDPEDREMVWRWFERFVYLGEEYILATQ